MEISNLSNSSSFSKTAGIPNSSNSSVTSNLPISCSPCDIDDHPHSHCERDGNPEINTPSKTSGIPSRHSQTYCNVCHLSSDSNETKSSGPSNFNCDSSSSSSLGKNECHSNNEEVYKDESHPSTNVHPLSDCHPQDERSSKNKCDPVRTSMIYYENDHRPSDNRMSNNDDHPSSTTCGNYSQEARNIHCHHNVNPSSPRYCEDESALNIQNKCETDCVSKDTSDALNRKDEEVLFKLGGDSSNELVALDLENDDVFSSDIFTIHNKEKPVKFELGGEALLLDGSEATRNLSFELKGIMRQKQNFSQDNVAEQNEDQENKIMKAPHHSRIRTLTFSEETPDPTSTSTRHTKALGLVIPKGKPEFSEVYTNNGSVTAPVRSSNKDARRTFSFAGDTMRRKCTRQTTISGDSTRSMDASASMNRIITRALSRTLTNHTCSSDGSNSTILMEEWKPIFDKFDLEADGKPDGKIPMDRFRAILDEDPIWSTSVPQHLKEKIIQEVDLNNDGVIDYEEFLILVKGKNLGLESRRRRAFRNLLKETVDFIVPYKYTYSNQYSCSPPPLFMLLFSLLQVFIFTYNSYVQIRSVGLYGPVPYCSRLIYNPNLRNQIWRFLTYSLIHSGLFHASFNILVQLILGIPLEMVHGGLRVSAVYLSGVLAGSLWTSVLKPGVYLSGASGGVYALIMGHLGTVIMNHREMSYPWCRVGIASLVGLTDIGVYVYETAMGKPAKPVSYPAHIAGAAAGLLVGIVCLRNLKWEAHQRYLWVVCVVVYAGLISVAIGWNIAMPSHFKGFNVTIPCEENLI